VKRLMNGRDSKAFGVWVSVHHGSVLSPLLFVIVIDALSIEFREGLTMELLYAGDLVLMAETEELLVEKIQKWKMSMEEQGLRVNLGKTNVMKCEAKFGPTENLWSCGVAGKVVQILLSAIFLFIC